MLIATESMPFVAVLGEISSEIGTLAQASGDSGSDAGPRLLYATRLIGALLAATLVTLLIDRRLRR